MKFFTKKEISIFLIFFILYSFFIQWNGWDENTRFFLTRAIVDEGKLTIDSFANQTSDRTYYNGHYYSDKDPGTSLFAVPSYALFKILYTGADTVANKLYVANPIGNTTVYDMINPGYFTLYSMIIVIIFTSVLFSSLTVVLIYKISNMYTRNEKNRLLITITAGVGSIIFPYALVFTDNAIAGFFALLGFYLLVKKKRDQVNQKTYSLVSGLCFGIGTLTSIFVIVISLIAFLYLFYFKNRKIRYWQYFILGYLVTASIYAAYNYVIYRNPIALSYVYLDKQVFPANKRNPYAVWKNFVPNLFITWRLLFDSYKGIFFFYPILLLSFYGIYLMWKKQMKSEVILIMSVFILNVVMLSSEYMWWGGGFFGTRHLTYFVPFFLIPLIFVLEKGSRIVTLLFLILLEFSALVNIAGVRVPAQEIIGPDRLIISDQYKSKVYSFEFLSDPIFDYYLPQFFATGPVSKIADTFSDCDYTIDIRQPLLLYLDKCVNPIKASGEVLLPKNKSLKVCACSQYAGGDGLVFNITIDRKTSEIYIRSNSCIKEYWNIPFADDKEHNIIITPGIFGKCAMEGFFIRSFDFVNQNQSYRNFPSDITPNITSK